MLPITFAQRANKGIEPLIFFAEVNQYYKTECLRILRLLLVAPRLLLIKDILGSLYTSTCELTTAIEPS